MFLEILRVLQHDIPHQETDETASLACRLKPRFTRSFGAKAAAGGPVLGGSLHGDPTTFPGTSAAKIRGHSCKGRRLHLW
jgi:hypothetical protein